ncbi:MAG: hypothetical protein AABY22_21930 [Nanoarchaeota archaeon]
MMTKKQKDTINFILWEIGTTYSDSSRNIELWVRYRDKLINYLDEIVLNKDVPASHFEFRE